MQCNDNVMAARVRDPKPLTLSGRSYADLLSPPERGAGQGAGQGAAPEARPCGIGLEPYITIARPKGLQCHGSSRR